MNDDAQTPAEGPWFPKKAPIMTRWAKDVRPDKVHPEYPRPAMARKDWMNLNGLWELEIKLHPSGKGGGEVPRFKGKVLVPFPVESALSGVMETVQPTDVLEYRRTFEVPTKWTGKPVLLHFGAVDWSTEVFLNGKSVGTHVGGYDPFSFDITDALRRSGPQELLVVVRDPTDGNWQPRGKQVMKPEGIWYTPTSGIWQTVWLEPVPANSIHQLLIKADQTGKLHLDLETRSSANAPRPRGEFTVELTDGTQKYRAEGTIGTGATLQVPNPKRWSPSSPTLYPIKVKWATDEVSGYVGFRTFELGKDDKGRTKFFLNGKPYFIIGPLDQGFWPDGLYTPPTEAAMKYDLEVTKKLGFNMIRKHVKVESQRWHYLCDKMGILVFQDMPSGDRYIGGRDPDITRTPESGKNFLNELQTLIEARQIHPSIVAWVPYNEGWGQWDTEGVTQFVRKLDPHRLVDNPSGWTDRGSGDMFDIHAYPGPASPKPEPNRAAFLGEFGGLGLPMPGHMWKSTGWGYQSFKTKEELTEGFVGLIQNLRFLIDDPGLSGAVYTQTTDVEVEVNGLLTYDREILKMDAKRVRKAIDTLFLPPPVVRSLIPTSEEAPQNWSYTTDKSYVQPAGDPTAWTKADFPTRSWLSGAGGFGTEGTPGSVVRTVWNTPGIWLRREILIPKVAIQNPHLRIHHDEDVEVYLNGELLLKRPRYTTGYVLVPLDRRLLIPGRHTLAVHCKQTGGGQYIDVGIVDVVG